MRFRLSLIVSGKQGKSDWRMRLTMHSWPMASFRHKSNTCCSTLRHSDHAAEDDPTGYGGPVLQSSVGLRIATHQQFIKDVYAKVIADGDDG